MKIYFHFTVIEAEHMTNPFPDLVLLFLSLSIHQDVPTESVKHIPNPIPLIETHISTQDEASSPALETIEVLPDQTDIGHTPFIAARKSRGVIKPPKYLRDFHCNMISQNSHPSYHSPHHIGRFISYDNLSSNH